jgi:4-hydroxy-2-oxoheptanedioate aldolase
MRTRWLLSIAVLAALTSLAMAQNQRRLNPVIELLQQKKPVFGLYAPSGGGRNAEPKTPAQRAAEALAYKSADYIFDGSMEGNFDRGYAGFTEFAQAMFAAGALQKTPAPRITHPLFLKTPRISRDPALAAERIAKQLNQGASAIVFVGVESAEELRAGIRAMRFKSKGGTRPDEVGNAPALWGMTEQEYREKADVWPLNPNGELVTFVIVESKEGIAKVREIAAVKGIGVLFPGAGTLRGVYSTTDANGQRVRDQQGYDAALQQVLDACREFSLACGFPSNTPEDLEARMKQGFNVFVINWGDNGFRAVEAGLKLSGR